MYITNKMFKYLHALRWETYVRTGLYLYSDKYIYFIINKIVNSSVTVHKNIQ